MRNKYLIWSNYSRKVRILAAKMLLRFGIPLVNTKKFDGFFIKYRATTFLEYFLRDEESYYAHRSDAREFYIHVISPYKASLDIWYINHSSVTLNMLILVSTALAVIVPSWDVGRFFNSLPDMPKEMIDSRSQQ